MAVTIDKNDFIRNPQVQLDNEGSVYWSSKWIKKKITFTSDLTAVELVEYRNTIRGSPSAASH